MASKNAASKRLCKAKKIKKNQLSSKNAYLPKVFGSAKYFVTKLQKAALNDTEAIESRLWDCKLSHIRLIGIFKTRKKKNSKQKYHIRNEIVQAYPIWISPKTHNEQQIAHPSFHNFPTHASPPSDWPEPMYTSCDGKMVLFLRNTVRFFCELGCFPL